MTSLVTEKASHVVIKEDMYKRQSQHQAKHEGVEKARQLYGDFVKEVIDYIRDQKHPDMKLMENGLLFANGKDKAITWMNSTVNGKPVVTRSGYIVEFNALWYNALCFYTELMGGVPVEGIDPIIKSMDKSFPETLSLIHIQMCIRDRSH